MTREEWRQVDAAAMDALRRRFGGRCVKCGARNSGRRWARGKVRPLEFAHVKPTGLCGQGRGLRNRYFDILKKPRLLRAALRELSPKARLDRVAARGRCRRLSRRPGAGARGAQRVSLTHPRRRSSSPRYSRDLLELWSDYYRQDRRLRAVMASGRASFLGVDVRRRRRALHCVCARRLRCCARGERAHALGARHVLGGLVNRAHLREQLELGRIAAAAGEGQPLLITEPPCSSCAHPRRFLLVRTARGLLCGPCWRRAGMPGPPVAAETLEEQAPARPRCGPGCTAGAATKGTTSARGAREKREVDAAGVPRVSVPRGGPRAARRIRAGAPRVRVRGRGG